MESGSNTADEASRGMNAKEFMQKSQWIKGPDFLWQAEDHWPQQDSYENEVDHNSLDVRKVTANVTVIEDHKNMSSRFERFSKWQVIKSSDESQCSRRETLAVDGPQVNGQSCACESCPATSFMFKDLEQAKKKFSSSCKRIISVTKSRF